MGILTNLNEEFDSEIIDDFLEHLEVINDSLEMTITNLSDYNYSDSINELFRIFHNLKSATAYLHINRINIFTKLVEDILEVARKRENFTEELRDWLYLCSSQLEKWYINITKDDNNLDKINPKILKTPKGY